MGRPRKYLTEEKKEAALRANSKRYYERHRKEQLERHKKWRGANRGYLREYRSSEEFKEWAKKRRKDPNTKKKIYAQNAVYRALRQGKIIKQPCKICGSLEVEAHHCDYNKPLDVMWFCREHHLDWHKNNTPIY